MSGSIFAYLALGVLSVAALKWRLKKQARTFGSAGWLAVWTASGKGLFRRGGLVAGDWTGLLPVHYRGDGHALTVAPTGAGKGTCAIVPNLLRHPFIFLLDPGGENTAIAIKAWRQKNYEVQVLNPWGMHKDAPWSLPSHSINPLDILDTKSMSFASDADLLAEMIITRSGSEGGSSAYFKDEAQSGIRAFLMHIASTEPKARRNLLTLREYITGETDSWDSLIAAMKTNKVGGGVIAREAAQLERREKQAAEEFSAVLSTMKQDTNFIEDPIMQKALAESNADLSVLKGSKGTKRLKGAVVCVVMPLEYLNTHSAYARLVTGVAIWEMQRAPIAREKVLFLLDEFPAMKRMDRIAGGLATLRKYKVWLWPIIQNLGQLMQLYGKNWQTFLSNAEFKQFLAAGDMETAEHVSKLCGDTTVETENRNPAGQVSIGQTRRLLATPDEIIHMASGSQIVMIGNSKPMLIRKTPYWKRPGLRGRFNGNPYHAGTPGLGWFTPFQAGWGQAIRFLAWLLRPSPVVVAGAVMLAALWLDPGIRLASRTDRAQGSLACEYITATGVKRYVLRRGRHRGQCPRFILGGYWIG